MPCHLEVMGTASLRDQSGVHAMTDSEANGGEPRIARCETHPDSHDFECPQCDAEFMSEQVLLNTLIAKNDELQRAIQNQGARLDPIVFIELKLRLILEIVTGNNPVFVHQFTSRYHNELNHILQQAIHEVQKQKLQVAPLDMSQLKRPKHRPR
jgi:hypothetical protein